MRNGRATARAQLCLCESQFNLLSPANKVQFQIMLAAEGSWTAIPNLTFSTRLQQAIATFQRRQGFDGDGAITADQLERLIVVVRPYFQRWGLANISHPAQGQPIWAPLAMLADRKFTEYGVDYTDQNKRLFLSYSYFPVDLTRVYDIWLEPSEKRLRIDYKVIRKDFFVVVETRRDDARSYTRYHRTPGGALGFRLVWIGDDTVTRGEQLATLISSSFYSRMLYGVSIPIPGFGGGPAPRQYEARAEPSPARVDPPATAAPRDSDSRPSSGSGFFVSEAGHILTNAHVIDKCTVITITPEGAPARSARLVSADKANDLALLSADMKPPALLPLRLESMKLGEGVVAFGFPLSSVLSRNGNFTLGNITALAGIGDDSRYLQVSTPVQPGNSGGPLLDYNGSVAGVVTAKLNAVRTGCHHRRYPAERELCAQEQPGGELSRR